MQVIQGFHCFALFVLIPSLCLLVYVVCASHTCLEYCMGPHNSRFFVILVGFHCKIHKIRKIFGGWVSRSGSRHETSNARYARANTYDPWDRGGSNTEVPHTGIPISPHATPPQVSEVWAWWSEIRAWHSVVLGCEGHESKRFKAMDIVNKWYYVKYRLDTHFHYRNEAPQPMWQDVILLSCIPMHQNRRPGFSARSCPKCQESCCLKTAHEAPYLRSARPHASGGLIWSLILCTTAHMHTHKHCAAGV